MLFTTAVGGLFGVAASVYRWNGQIGAYEVFHAVGPTFLNTLILLTPLGGLWIYVTSAILTDWLQPGLAAAAP